jgi:hypothetical protein
MTLHMETRVIPGRAERNGSACCSRSRVRIGSAAAGSRWDFRPYPVAVAPCHNESLGRDPSFATKAVVAKAKVSVSEERPRGPLFSFHRLSSPTDQAPGSGSDRRDPPIGSGLVGAVAPADLGHWTLVRRDSEAQNSFRTILPEEVRQLVGRVCTKRLSGDGSSGDFGSPGRADPRK